MRQTEQTGPRGLFLWQLLLLAYGAGIVALRDPLMGAVGLAVLGLCIRSSDPARFRPLPLLVVFVLGFCLAAVRLPAQPEIPAWIAERERVELSGLVVEAEQRPEGAWRLILDDLACLREDGAHETLPGRLVLSWHYPPRPPAPGARLTTSTRVYPQGGFRNFGGADFSFYWQTRGVFWRAYARGDAAILEAPAVAGIWARRLALVERISALAPKGQAGALVTTLLAGDRSGLSLESVERLRAAALAHTLALSGLHLAMAVGLGAALAFIVGRVRPSIYLRLPLPRLAVLMAAPLALLYVWLGGASHSLLRAALMFAAFGFMLWRGRRGAFLDGLFLALAVLLLLSPLSLFDLGLRMSALAVAGIIVGAPYFDRLAKRLSERLIPAERARFLLRWPLCILGVSLCANLALLPLTLQAFGEVPLGLVWNLFWLPLMQVWLMPVGLAALVPLALGLDGAAAWLLWLASLPAEALFALLARADASGLLVALTGVRPLWPAMLGAWLLAVWFFLPRRPLVVLGLCFALLAGPVALAGYEERRERVAVELIDVGQGLAVLVEGPGGARLLLDAGGLASRTFDVGRAVVVPRLTLNRDPRLDVLAVSHADRDHAGGAAAVVRALQVGGFAWNGRDGEAHSLRELLPLIDARGVDGRVVAAGERIDLGRELRLDVLHPAPDFSGRGSNDGSLVLRLVWRGRPLALLPGDVERAGIRALLDSGSELSADLLVLPHHGAAGSLSPALLDAVAPRIAAAGTGWLNQWNFPSCAVREALGARGVPLYDTGAHGAVRVIWDGPDTAPRVRTFLAEPAPREPCAERPRRRTSGESDGDI